MRLRTFHASDMPSAMKMVRDTLGDDAVILATEPHNGRGGISVTAAIDYSDHGAKTKPEPAPPGQDHLRLEIHNIFRFHNIPELYVSKLLQKASARELSSFSAMHHISANRDEKPLVRLLLEKIFAQFFEFAPLSSAGEHRIMLIGAPGIGKTLTIAKLAARLSMAKQPVAVFTTDNQRAGGVEQLQAYTNILELPLHVIESPAELARELKKLPPDMPALVDTAGCNPYDKCQLNELIALAAHEAVEPIMVLPAGGDSAETIDIVESFTALPIKRLLVTRADTARRFGSIIGAAAAHGLAFCGLSESSSIVNPLSDMDAGGLAQMLLRYQLQNR